MVVSWIDNLFQSECEEENSPHELGYRPEKEGGEPPSISCTESFPRRDDLFGILSTFLTTVELRTRKEKKKGKKIHIFLFSSLYIH